MGAHTQFGLEIRAALCDHCGAPIQCTIAGGQVRCKFCRTVNIIRRRAPVEPRARSASAGMPERERLGQLWLQDCRPLPIPAKLQGWLRGGQLARRHRDEVLQEWIAARKLLLQRPDDRTQSDYVFILALYLASVLDAHHTRALLENTVDILPTEVDGDVIRCMLAHQAALEGELDAADAWLRRVDPRPRLLLQDTAFRLASSTLAFCRRQPEEVLRILGRHEGEIPIFDGFDDEAELYRCHALEVLGHAQEASDRLWRRTRNAAALRPLAVLVERDPRLPLCPKSWPAVEEKRWDQWDEQMRGAIRPGLPPWAWGALCLGALGVLLYGVVAAVLGLQDAGGAITVGLGLTGWVFSVAYFEVPAHAIADRAERAYARVVAARVKAYWAAQGQGQRGVQMTAEVTVEGVRRELTWEKLSAFAYVGYELPCIFDPESGRFEVVIPAFQAPRLVPPLPFG